MEYIGLADNVKHNIFEFPTPTDMIFSNKGQDEVFFKLSSPKQRSPPETVRFQTRNMKTTPAEDLPRGFDHNKTQMIATVKQEEDESTPGCGFATAQNNTGCQWFFACDVNGYTGGSVRMNCNDYVTADKSRSNRECFSFTNDHRRGLTKSELRQSRSTPKFAVDDSESKVSGSSARRSALNQEKYIKEENMVEFDSNELLCEKQAPPFNTDRSFWQGSLNNKGSETCQKRIPGIEFNPAKQPRSGVTLSSDQLPYRELPQTDWTYFQRELNTGSLANENNKASIFNNMDFSEFMDDISGALGATNIGIEDSDLEIDAEWRNLENQSIPNDMPTDIGCDKMNSRKEQPGFDLGNNEINLLLEAIQTRSFLPIAYLLCSALNTKGHPTDLSDLTSFKLDTISKLLATNICTHVDDEIPSISISSDKFAPTLSSQSSCDSEHSSVWSYCQPSLSDGFDTNEVIMNSDTNESEISYDAYRNHSTGSKRPSLHDISEFTVPKSRRREESENSTESKENSPHELVNFFDEMIKCNSRCDLQTFQDLLESKDETIEAKLSNTRFLKQASTTAKERETGTYEKGVAQNSPILLMDQNNNAQSTTDCGNIKEKSDSRKGNKHPNHRPGHPVPKRKSNSKKRSFGTGSVDGPSVLMEGVRGEHEHHNQQKNNEEEDKANKCYHLWDFLRELLDSNCTADAEVIQWINKEQGEFKLTDTKRIAELWGKKKKLANMNYDKLSRSLRYYIKLDILRKVPGKRLHFKFGKGKMWRKMSK